MPNDRSQSVDRPIIIEKGGYRPTTPMTIAVPVSAVPAPLPPAASQPGGQSTPGSGSGGSAPGQGSGSKGA